LKKWGRWDSNSCGQTVFSLPIPGMRVSLFHKGIAFKIPFNAPVMQIFAKAFRGAQVPVKGFTGARQDAGLPHGPMCK